jgi:8-oxo-dGTP diphosphatase
MIFLVRHAKAGHRDPTVPDDTQRPLTPNGWNQAKALIEPLVEAGATDHLLSSPYVRCMQTLEPLAIRLDTNVIADDRLAEEQPLAPLLDLLVEVPEGSVLCSHGDMIPDVIAALQRRRCTIATEPNWKKGAVWALTRKNGAFVSASAWPPPE